MIVVFGKSRYEKYNKTLVAECWKELRDRFLHSRTDVQGTMTFDSIVDFAADRELKLPCHNTLGEFALEQLHWMGRAEGGAVKTFSADEWQTLVDPDKFKSHNLDGNEEKEKKVINRRHRRRLECGLEPSPNVQGFTLAQVRLIVQQIRLSSQMDSDMPLGQTVTLGDFAIRYLCSVQFKRYVQKRAKAISSK